MRRKRKRKPKDYRPSRAEIVARCEAMQWMVIQQWPEELIDSIMTFDMPNVDRVRSIVRQFGPWETMLRLCDILDIELIEIGYESDGD